MFFFFNDTATTEIYTLSLHDALPIYTAVHLLKRWRADVLKAEMISVQLGLHPAGVGRKHEDAAADEQRSEEHTSELQSRSDLVCRLLLEKKKQTHLDYRYEHGSAPAA